MMRNHRFDGVRHNFTHTNQLRYQIIGFRRTNCVWVTKEMEAIKFPGLSRSL